MFESRCGICCGGCERKTEVNGKGCLKMEKPFWGGACGVKSCCEERRLNHCGLYSDFPCEMFVTTGVEQGYDPMPRMDQCRKWAMESRLRKRC